MRLKQRPGDFHVRELLNDNYLTEKGDYAVYRITKKKMTTPEAIKALATETGLETGDIKFAGLKDRQAVTTQYMSVPRKHNQVTLNEGDLRIEHAGYAESELTSDHSRGNGFEITVRALWREDVRVLRNNLDGVREHGLINYFDDQRFGNLRHDQGWVARELMLGNMEEGLKRMLFWPSPFDSARYERYKGDIGRNWGNWSKCAGISRGFGEHFSIFDHLEKNPEDFAGAFYFAPSRIRLIHLYAYQSHIWNRAAALLIRDACAKEERTVLSSDEGALPTFEGASPADLVMRAGLRLPGSRLEDCGDDKAVFERVLAAEGLTAEQFHIEGVSGFALKGEDRPLVVVPGHLRVRPAEEDRLNRGCSLVKLRFELPRGSYATLVVKRIFEMSAEMKLEQEKRERERDENPEGGRGSRFGGGSFNKRQGQGFQDRGRDRNRDDSAPNQESQGGYRRQEGSFARGGGGGYQGGNRDSGGGYRGGGNREGGGYQGRGGGGGYQGGNREGGGGYRGGGNREGGGYQGRGGGGGYQGGNREGGGGYRGGGNREGGGYQGRGGGGGYQGGNREGGGGYRGGGNREGGGYQGRGGGGYQGGNREGGGGYRGGGNREGGGYQGRGGGGGYQGGNREGGGGYRGGGNREGGGYQGRGGGGGYQGGNREGGGGYRGGGNREGGGYQGRGGGGYQGGNREGGGGYRGGGNREGGGYQGRGGGGGYQGGNREGGGGYRGGGNREGGGYQGRGGGGGYQGGNREGGGGYRGGGNREGGGYQGRGGGGGYQGGNREGGGGYRGGGNREGGGYQGRDSGASSGGYKPRTESPDSAPNTGGAYRRSGGEDYKPKDSAPAAKPSGGNPWGSGGSKGSDSSSSKSEE